MLTRHLLLWGAALLLACDLSSPPPESRPAEPASVPAAESHPRADTCDAPGILQSRQAVILSAAESGAVELPLPRGATVSAGEVVATIASPSLKAIADGARASLQVTRAERGLAQRRLSRAREETAEVDRLGEFAGGSERRDASHARALSLEELKASDARVREQEAEARGARAGRYALTLRAPFAATIADVFVDVDAYVSTGTPVLRLVAPSRDDIRFAVPRRNTMPCVMAARSPGPRLTVPPRAGPGSASPSEWMHSGAW